jgi:hypothetical protein
MSFGHLSVFSVIDLKFKDIQESILTSLFEYKTFESFTIWYVEVL